MFRSSLIRRHDGFTIVELMLALAFLSVMLLFILSATIQVMRSYSKGLTVKQMNQVGRTITEDLARTARTASPGSVSTAHIDDGRLCIGGISYIWNEPQVDATSINTNKFTGGMPDDFHIARVVDTASPPHHCSGAGTTVPPDDPGTSILSSGAVRILGMQVEQSDDERLLHVKFSVSSVGTDKPVLVGSEYQCPTDSNSLFGTFCAIADFESTIYLRNTNGE